jgi:transposase-like protein
MYFLLQKLLYVVYCRNTALNDGQLRRVNQQSLKCGTPRTLYHCSFCERSFSETRNTPIAHWKTPIALVVQVLTALTEGGGINAATRLYSVSKKSISRWQERLSGVKKRCCCLL